jgi:hypothetical protein
MFMNVRRRNWSLWIGSSSCFLAFPSYFLLFVRFPVTRDVPWANYLLFAAGLLMVGIGIRRAYTEPQVYRGKIAGPTLGIISLAVTSLFCFTVLFQTRQLPKSSGAPRVGQKAPEFVLTDTNNNQVSLSSLLSTPLERTHTPPKGVVLIFYRGYW